mgnify:FL=1
MKIKLLNSPNYSRNSRPKKSIKFIIIHYTGMQSEIESINRLIDKNSKVSCHYLINRKGTITQMVKENKIAWHAGVSKWKNIKNLNKNSIGIELVNKGHFFGYENYSNLQINSLIKLCSKLKKKYKIHKENFLGHSDIAPYRKIDPGEKFPWKKLSNYKLGKWYNLKKAEILSVDKKKLFFKNLYKIGYRYFKIGKRVKSDKLIIKAFQRRYNPKKITGYIDLKTLKISQFLAKN